VQALSTAVQGEEVSGEARLPLDLATASKLFRERGYDIVCRFGHVHTTRDGQEWHLCLEADLVSTPPGRLLACLEEALALCVEPRLALSPRT
jgi:hypothetical protein